MKAKEMLETYPEVAKIIRNWFTEKIIENMKDSNEVPEDFKNLVRKRGVEDEFLINVIDKNPSALFELFDTLHVYVGISVVHLPVSEKVVFNYYICPKGECSDDVPEDFFNRKDVEYYATLAAVEYINTHLGELKS